MTGNERDVNLQEEDMVYGITVAEFPSDEDRRKAAALMADCPYLIHYALLDDAQSAIWVSMVPPDREWWLRAIHEEPELMGATFAMVFISKEVCYPRTIKMRMHEPTADRSPCGYSCEECQYYKVPCRGCPATKFYLKEPIEK
jgi:hypothetical protein